MISGLMKTVKTLTGCVLLVGFVMSGKLNAQTTGTESGGTSIGEVSSIGGELDADTAFAEVQRGDTVGATGATGSGFSGLSSASGTGSGGVSSFGGFGGGLGALGGLQGLFGGLGGQAQNSKPVIRTRLRSAIVSSRPPMIVQQQRAGDRFLPLARPEFNDVMVEIRDGMCTLTGIVDTPRDRRMSELLLRLEPGVRLIKNELEVKPLP